jgi:hypothetical protein
MWDYAPWANRGGWQNGALIAGLSALVPAKRGSDAGMRYDIKG